MDAISAGCLNPDGLSFKRGTIVFYAGTAAIDDVIAIGEGGSFTHAVISQGDGSAICAWAGGGGMPAGVQDHWQDYPPVRTQFTDIEARPYPGDVDVFIAALTSYLGKPYDTIGLVTAFLAKWFGIKIGGPPSAFTCSSLIAWCVAPEKNWGCPPRDVTPQQLYAWLT